jgi:hypothetical protein
MRMSTLYEQSNVCACANKLLIPKNLETFVCLDKLLLETGESFIGRQFA